MEVFSIREYTSKIRATNVEKCWPFDGHPKDIKQELVQEFLPPIVVKKFRWWSNELEKCENGFKKAGLEEESVEEENLGSVGGGISGHNDGFVVHECKKMAVGAVGVVAKAKQPKKRSIMEIFAVAPQIEDMGFEEYDREDEVEEGDMRVLDIVANAKRKRRKAETGEEGEKDVVGIMRKLKKSNKKKRKKIANCVPKEKTQLKDSIQPGLAGKLKLSSKTTSSSKPYKLKTTPTSKKYQEQAGNPVYSILKKHTVLTGKTSDIADTEGGVHTKPCHQVDKRVRFSGKDCIIGNASFVGHGQPQKNCELHSEMVISSVNCQLETGSNVLPATNEKAGENRNSKEVVTSDTHGAEIRNVNGKEGFNDIGGCVVLPTSGNSHKKSRNNKGQGPSDESMRLTWDFQSQENSYLPSLYNPTSSYSPFYSGIPDIRSSIQTSGRNLPDFCASTTRCYTMNALSNSMTSSFAMIREADERYPFLSQNASQNLNMCDLQYQPFSHLPPNDLMTSICSSVEPRQRKASLYQNKFVDDDYIGLPLNSQGELIKLHSSGKGGLNQLQNMMSADSNFPAQNLGWPESASNCSDQNDVCYVETRHAKDNFKLFPEQNHGKIPDMKSRTGMTELQGPGRGEFQWRDSTSGKNQSVYQLGLDLNQMNISSCSCSQYTESYNQNEKEKVVWVENADGIFLPTTQPTMRLMGKDVTVGRNYKKVPGYEEGKVWMDKNVIKEQRPTVGIDNSPFSRSYQMGSVISSSSGKSKETRTQLLGAQRKHAAIPCFSKMYSVEPRSSHTSHNWQASTMPQSGLHLDTNNQSVKMNPYSWSLPSEELMRRTLRTPGTCNFEKESLNLTSEVRVSAPSHYPCPCMRASSTQLLYNQAPAGSSSFPFPFVNQDCGKCVQASQSQSSSKHLSHWMLNHSQQKGNPFIFSEYDTSANSRSYNMFASNLSAITSPYCTAMISPPSQHAKSLPPTLNTSGTYLVHRPIVPVPPGFRSNPVNKSHRKGTNLKSKMKPHIVHIKDSVQSRRTNMTSAEYSKKPNLELPVGSSKAAERGKEVNFRESSVYGMEAPIHDTYKDNRINIEPLQKEICKDDLRTSASSNSFNMDGVVRSGPIKLTAGAKHILKPNTNTDHINSTPVHSRIPIGSVSDSGKVSALQRKPSKVYRL